MVRNADLRDSETQHETKTKQERDILKDQKRLYWTSI